MNQDEDEQTLAELAFDRLLGPNAPECIISPWSLSFVSELAESWSQITEEAWLQPPGQHIKQGACVKTYRPWFFQGAKGALRSFLQEVHRLRQLQHRHLVHIAGVGCYNSQTWLSVVSSVYLVEEYAGPMTLARLIASRQLSPDEPSYCYTYLDALRWMAQLAEVLAYLHEQGIPHGDVRSHNLFFTVPDVHKTDIRLADLKPHRHTYRQDLRCPTPHKHPRNQTSKAVATCLKSSTACNEKKRIPTASSGKNDSYPQESLRHFNTAHTDEPLVQSGKKGKHVAGHMAGDSFNSLEGHAHGTSEAHKISRVKHHLVGHNIPEHEQQLLEQAGRHAEAGSPASARPLARASWSFGIGPTMRNPASALSDRKCSPSPSPPHSPFLLPPQSSSSVPLQAPPALIQPGGGLITQLSAPLGSQYSALERSGSNLARRALGSGHLMSAANTPRDAHVLADLAVISAVTSTCVFTGSMESITRISRGMVRYSFSATMPVSSSPLGGSPASKARSSIKASAPLGVLPEGSPLDLGEHTPSTCGLDGTHASSGINGTLSRVPDETCTPQDSKGAPVRAPDEPSISSGTSGTALKGWGKSTVEGRTCPVVRSNTPPGGVVQGSSPAGGSPVLSTCNSLSRQVSLERRTSMSGVDNPLYVYQGCDLQAVLQALTPVSTALSALGMGDKSKLVRASTTLKPEFPQAAGYWKPLLTPLARPQVQQPHDKQLLQRTSLPPVLPLPEELAKLDAQDPAQRTQHAQQLKQQVLVSVLKLGALASRSSGTQTQNLGHPASSATTKNLKPCTSLPLAGTTDQLLPISGTISVSGGSVLGSSYDDLQRLDTRDSVSRSSAQQAIAVGQRASAAAWHKSKSNSKGRVRKSVSFASKPADNKLPGCALSCMTAPPEALKDPAAACTPAADVFAFGQVMYEAFMCSVLAPAGNTDAAQWQFIQDHVAAAAHGKHSPLPSYWPSKLTSLIRSCWAVHPKDRPSMATILHKLRAWQHDIDIQRALLFADRTHSYQQQMELLQAGKQQFEERVNPHVTQGCGCVIC